MGRFRRNFGLFSEMKILSILKENDSRVLVGVPSVGVTTRIFSQQLLVFGQVRVVVDEGEISLTLPAGSLLHLQTGEELHRPAITWQLFLPNDFP